MAQLASSDSLCTLYYRLGHTVALLFSFNQAASSVKQTTQRPDRPPPLGLISRLAQPVGPSQLPGRSTVSRLHRIFPWRPKPRITRGSIPRRNDGKAASSSSFPPRETHLQASRGSVCPKLDDVDTLVRWNVAEPPSMGIGAVAMPPKIRCHGYHSCGGRDTAESSAMRLSSIQDARRDGGQGAHI